MKGRVVDWAKRFLWLPLVVVLLLAGPLAAEEPTPLTAVLPAGEVATIACLSPYGARQNVPDWPPDGIFHYRLYLPSDYHDQPARQYPLMFIASPAGEAEMGHMAERLTRDRWVVAMLAESRKPLCAVVSQFHGDVQRRAEARTRALRDAVLHGLFRRRAGVQPLPKHSPRLSGPHSAGSRLFRTGLGADAQ